MTHDLEIYTKDIDTPTLIQWVQSHFNEADEVEERDGQFFLIPYEGSIVITPQVEDSEFTSLWFNTPHLTWKNSLELAKDASRELSCPVRCDPAGSNYAVSDPSAAFLEVNAEQINWVSWE